MIRYLKILHITILFLLGTNLCFAQNEAAGSCSNNDGVKVILAKQHADLEVIANNGKIYDANAEARLKVKMQEVAATGNEGKERVMKISSEHMTRYQSVAMGLLQKFLAILGEENKAEKNGDLEHACQYSLELRQQTQKMVAAHKTYYEGLIKALDTAKAAK